MFEIIEFENGTGIDVEVRVSASTGDHASFSVRGGQTHTEQVRWARVQALEVQVEDKSGAHTTKQDLTLHGSPAELTARSLALHWFPGRLRGTLVTELAGASGAVAEPVDSQGSAAQRSAETEPAPETSTARGAEDDSAADITYSIDKIDGKKATGRLKWPDKGLDSEAISGPYGKGYLPDGTYTAKRSKLVDDCGSNKEYEDPKGNCWFQAISPDFTTDRKGLGIHPDGNVRGTEGCIGLLDRDTKPWYDALYSVDKSKSVKVLVSGGEVEEEE